MKPKLDIPKTGEELSTIAILLGRRKDPGWLKSNAGIANSRYAKALSNTERSKLPSSKTRMELPKQPIPKTNKGDSTQASDCRNEGLSKSENPEGNVRGPSRQELRRRTEKPKCE